MMLTTFDPFDAAKMMVTGFLMLTVCIVEALAATLIYSIQLLWEYKLSVFLGIIALAFAICLPHFLVIIACLVL